MPRDADIYMEVIDFMAEGVGVEVLRCERECERSVGPRLGNQWSLYGL